MRDILAANINVLLQIQWHPSASNVEEILENNRQNENGIGFIPAKIPNNLQEIIIQELVESLEKWRAEKKPTSAGSSEYVNASKTGIFIYLFESLCMILRKV